MRASLHPVSRQANKDNTPNMKLLFVLLFCAASAALLRAEEPETHVDFSDNSLDFLHDGSLEDEVLGHEEDPHHALKKKLLRKLGVRLFCARRVFKPCMQRAHKLPCRIRIKVCKAAFFTCHCIVKGVGKCVRFLRFVKKLKEKLEQKKPHDEVEDEEDEEEQENPRKRKSMKFKHFMRCIKHAKKHCKPRLFKLCVKKFFFGRKKGDEDEASAQLAESEDEEDEEDKEEVEDPHRMMMKKKHFPKWCVIFHVRCVNRARFNCRRHVRCYRRLKRCIRISRLIHRIRQHKRKDDE